MAKTDLKRTNRRPNQTGPNSQSKVQVPVVKATPSKVETVTVPSSLFSDRRRLDRLALSVTLSFCLSVLLVNYFMDGALFSHTIEILRSVEGTRATASKNAAENCKDERNKNTPYCQERIARIESDWQAISRYSKGRVTQFTLHEKGKSK